MARIHSTEYTPVDHHYKWFTQFQRWFLELHMLESHRQYIEVHPQLLLGQSLPTSGTCFRLDVHKPKSGGKLKALPQSHQGNYYNHLLTAWNVPSYLQVFFLLLTFNIFLCMLWKFTENLDSFPQIQSGCLGKTFLATCPTKDIPLARC